MGLCKKDIVKNIYTKANISNDDSKKFLNKFFEIIIHQTKNQNVKLSRFGVFYNHSTPKRLGRNPKTKEEFIIPKRNKLSFKSSNKVKAYIN